MDLVELSLSNKFLFKVMDKLFKKLKQRSITQLYFKEIKLAILNKMNLVLGGDAEIREMWPNKETIRRTHKNVCILQIGQLLIYVQTELSIYINPTLNTFLEFFLWNTYLMMLF